MNEYQNQFKEFITGLGEFYMAIEKWYEGKPTNSMQYFLAHFPRFEAMIKTALQENIKPKTICELGSFYPYTSYYFKTIDPRVRIDCYDIVLRELAEKPKFYDINGIKFHDFNLCLDGFPRKKYDLIILSEVMEHLPMNLFELEQKVIDIMADNGFLFVTYPMLNHNAQDYEKIVGNLSTSYGEHLREFNEETIKLFFNKLEKIIEVPINYPAYGYIKVVLYKKHCINLVQK